MSKPLEPTEEQLDDIQDLGGGHTRAELREHVWPLIRDMVLDAAARECERPVVIPGMWDVAPDKDECARRIRAMKGAP
jgi:hypothetical protein